MTDDNTIRDQILRLLNVRKKLKDGDYLTSREEEEVSLILGIPKFINRKEMERKIDEFFVWASEIFRKTYKIVHKLPRAGSLQSLFIHTMNSTFTCRIQIATAYSFFVHAIRRTVLPRVHCGHLDGPVQRRGDVRAFSGPRRLDGPGSRGAQSVFQELGEKNIRPGHYPSRREGMAGADIFRAPEDGLLVFQGRFPVCGRDAR